MNSLSNRNESYHKSLDDFPGQDEIVLTCIRRGFNHAWGIAIQMNMLITSVRRSLTNLKNKGIICESGTVYYPQTKRNVTTYKIQQTQIKLF